jgi:hypothetical protein
MRFGPGHSLFTIFVVFASLQFSACRCPKSDCEAAHLHATDAISTSSDDRDDAMKPIVMGRGFFIDKGGDRFAVFSLRGAHSRYWPHPDQVSLVDLKIYGASGLLGADQLATPAHFLYPVPLAYPTQRSWEVGPRVWPTDRTVWAIGQPYTLLFRHTYQVDDGVHVTEHVVDSVRAFEPPTPLVPMNGVFAASATAHSPGDTIQTITVNGTFTLPPPAGQSLYDVALIYAPPGVARVEIFAAAADAMGNPPADLFPADLYPASQSSPNFLYTEEITDPAKYSWRKRNISGPYNGADKYFLGVRFTEGANPPTTKVATFSGIQAHPSEPMWP